MLSFPTEDIQRVELKRRKFLSVRILLAMLYAVLIGLLGGFWAHFIPCIWWTCDLGYYDGQGMCSFTSCLEPKSFIITFHTIFLLVQIMLILESTIFGKICFFSYSIGCYTCKEIIFMFNCNYRIFLGVQG